MREVNLKAIEVMVNIGSDQENISKMYLVFDGDRPTEMFNGIQQAVKDLEIKLKQVGILTADGIGTGEYKDYLEYMKERVVELEEERDNLILVRDDVLNNKFTTMYVVVAMLDEQLADIEEELEKYYGMFKAIEYVEVTEDNVNDFIKKDEQ